jgi:uncharacterized protein YbaA (DUF1428 family)
MGKIWGEHSALAYAERLANDVKPGKHTSSPQAVKLKPGETVMFSWIVHASHRQRDGVLKNAMGDPRMTPMFQPIALPFDGKRMFLGWLQNDR